MRRSQLQIDLSEKRVNRNLLVSNMPASKGHQNTLALDSLATYWKQFLLLSMFVVFILITSKPSQATSNACEAPSLATTWVNAETKLKELSRLKIDYNCGEKPIKPYDPLSASLWIIRGYMTCGRTDCIWGRAKGETQPGGEMWVTFSSFATIRKLKLNQESGLLKVDVETIYRDEKRKSFNKTYYLHPENH